MAHDVKFGIEKNLSFCYQQRIFWMNIDVNIWIQAQASPRVKDWNNYLEEATSRNQPTWGCKRFRCCFFQAPCGDAIFFLNVGDMDSGMISTFLATLTLTVS